MTATGAVLTKAQADGELLNGNQRFDAWTFRTSRCIAHAVSP
jgi:hypothetical protein